METEPRPAAAAQPVHATEPIAGRPVEIGDGFRAVSFSQQDFDGLMDPLVMVDHFTMTEPTFGPHPHAGMSAVSVLFEDSEGRFLNRDSLGNEIDLEPGDLYWLKAARGAVHDEHPHDGARTHALQVFVNLPSRAKQDAPEALHVKAADMPQITGDRARVRIVLGESHGVTGARGPALPLTILDAHLAAGGTYEHVVPAGQDVWLHAVRGQAEVRIGEQTRPLPPGRAVALRTGPGTLDLELLSADGAQIVVLHGSPIRERIVQRGPYVMNSHAEIEAAVSAFAAGEFGSID